MRSPSVSFGGHDLIPTPSGALWWPSRRAMLVADLHFEKASWFARAGMFLPPYDSVETLRCLAECADKLGATELWCLGDSFHDSAGVERMPEGARAALDALTARLDWTWITGNHDPGIGDIGGRVLVEAEVDGLLLRHEAQAGETRPELSGHFHPKVGVTIRGRRIVRRCFVASERKMILPAFGTLTGGMDAADPAILSLMDGEACALVPMDDRLLRFPLELRRRKEPGRRSRLARALS